MKKIALILLIAGSASANPTKQQQSLAPEAGKPININQKLGSPGGNNVVSSEESFQEKLGLKPGDIIKSINGKPMNSPKEAMAISELMKTSGKIEVEILRGEKTHKMIYEVK